MTTTTSIGQQAEVAASRFLADKEYKILARNWRTKYCEIDIVARLNKVVYFVEVKYRLSNKQGSGLDYITSQKLRQMGFAAEIWVNQQRWSGDYHLAAIEVSGRDFIVTNFVASLT
jgi:Holliday junction resolvase-like predicted endonuclease